MDELTPGLRQDPGASQPAPDATGAAGPPAGPASANAARPEAFPTTQATLLTELLKTGEPGRREAARHVMAVYARPLKVYLTGSSFRETGDPDEIVEAFFADRLVRPGFLAGWAAGGRRLRLWLIRAFKNYLLEQRRAARRGHRPRAVPESRRAPGAGDPEAAFHREAALSIAREALRLAEQRCLSAGLHEHWRVFLRHHLDGEHYRSIAEAAGMTPVRAGVMARTAATRFKGALRELAGWPGAAADEVDLEIQALMEALNP